MSQQKDKYNGPSSKEDSLINSTQQTSKIILSKSDEIDLKVLWEQFVDFLRKAIKITIKRGVILLILLAIGGGWGYYRHQVSLPVFKTRMLIDAKVADYSILSGLIGTLQDLADEYNTDGIAKTLKVDAAVAKSIVSIKAVDKLVVFKDLSSQQSKEFDNQEKQQSSKERDKEIFQLKEQKFAIEVSLYDNRNFPVLEKALLAYLRSNKYLKKRVELKKQYYSSLKNKVKKEIQELDSLKKNISSIFVKKNQNIQITDPGTISQLYDKAIKLREKELKIDTTLAAIESIQVVEGFVKFNRPSIKVTKRIKIGLLVGFAIWVLLVLWLDFRKPFLKFLEEGKKKA